MIGSAVVASVAAKLNTVLTPTVYDGSSAVQNAGFEMQWASIGDPWDDDQEPIVTERVETGAGPRYREDHQIACKAYAGSGVDDITVCRALASQMLEDIRAALATDRTLTGTVARVKMGDVDRWEEGRDEQGVGVRIGFTIDVTVFV